VLEGLIGLIKWLAHFMHELPTYPHARSPP
jgi:hypothetical protein